MPGGVPTTDDEFAILNSRTFGKYQILERIATGGMAEIYRAQLHGKAGFQRQIAIKIILPSLSSNTDHIQLLANEAKVAGTLTHPNIVQIYDLGEQNGDWFIAMELVEGYDLAKILRRIREKGIILPIPHAVYITFEVLKGLEYAHRRTVTRDGVEHPLKLVHRDISPSNILLSQLGEVKLTDFGIAQASLQVLETVSGIVKGKYDYMSPEQATNSELDARSDLFTVGVVLYQMLTGAHPFRADNELATVNRIRTGRYTPICQRNPDIPLELESIVNRAISPNAADRYTDAGEFREALDHFFQASGFIFTQANLENYLKNLFPELKKPTAPPVSKPTPVPSPVRSQSNPIPRSPTAQPPHQVDELTDESELVTLVRESPMASEEVSRVPTTDTHALTDNQSTSWANRAKGVALVSVLVTTGVAIGLVIGLVASFVVVPRPAPAPPVLQVNAPPRTAIQVDGDAVSSVVTLKPGVTHQIEITTRGFKPWKTVILAEAGREYIISVVHPSGDGPRPANPSDD